MVRIIKLFRQPVLVSCHFCALQGYRYPVRSSSSIDIAKATDQTRPDREVSVYAVLYISTVKS